MSAETLKVILRHEDFKTTDYGAVRAVQSAAEVHQKLAECKKGELVGGLARPPSLSPEELRKLKALLNAI